MDLTGRTAIITGGASGIGHGICRELAERGADIVVADLNTQGAEVVAAEVAEIGRQSMVAALDVTDPSSIDALTETALAHFGKIDILVNNAGVGGAMGWDEHQQARVEDWDYTYQVNLRGVALTADAVAVPMIEQRSGKIINIASIAGRQGSPTITHYNASKAGVISLTQGLALRLAPYNINVNAICPGLLWTPLWERLAARNRNGDQQLEGLTEREVFERRVAASVPLGREQTPEDIGKLAAFLASEDARNITGQSINVDGGARMN